MNLQLRGHRYQSSWQVGLEGSEYIWKDTDHSKRYAVSLKNEDTELNEISLLEQSDNSFLGQYVPIDEGANGLDLLKGLATKGINSTGHYDVASVDNGTSRTSNHID